MATDRQNFKEWELYRESLINATHVPMESVYEQSKRIKKLEANHEEWFKYYFPNYYTSEPALFHKKASKRFIKNKRWYEVRAWSRELAKSVRSMMEVLYIAYATEGNINMLLVSNNEDSAINLLAPFKINIESNQRLIHDYGTQQTLGRWTDGSFKMKNKSAFNAVGAGQSPRGTREEELRPNIIIFDDIDTDEEVRNPDRIDKKWAWIERAVFPTISVDKDIRILFNGNIIGKDTCITRATKQADHVDIINIRDKQGKSTWAKNSEKKIDWILSKISYASGQQEYFNNPITEGTVFKSITWGKIPRIDSFRHLILYGDPSYSNKTNKQNSHKCVALMGNKDDKYYVFTCKLDKATNSEFVEWYNELEGSYSHKTVQSYNYVENNSLQNPFFEQVLEPEFKKQNTKIKGDDRKKPDKFFRVEGNLEPLNRKGALIFNEKEKDNPHMKRLEDQFLAFSDQTAQKLDGPDTIEGAIYILDNKMVGLKKTDITVRNKTRKSKHRI